MMIIIISISIITIIIRRPAGAFGAPSKAAPPPCREAALGALHRGRRADAPGTRSLGPSEPRVSGANSAAQIEGLADSSSHAQQSQDMFNLQTHTEVTSTHNQELRGKQDAATSNC
jgi:hypothetical protein